ADTIVVYDGCILGKPADEKDASDTLKRLKNDVHSVMTGVAVCDAESENTSVFCEETRVFFSDYTEEDIRGYIATGEPADKAGSYAIQGGWSKFVRKIEGDYDNVVGLPWKRLEIELARFGV
ncbi:MAG: Maf family protein, partial [Anaerovoracaceae bacterium]